MFQSGEREDLASLKTKAIKRAARERRGNAFAITKKRICVKRNNRTAVTERI